MINEPSQPHEQAPSRESQGCNEAGSLLGAEIASLDFCSSAWGWELNCAGFTPWIKQVVFSLVLTPQPVQSSGSGVCLFGTSPMFMCMLGVVAKAAQTCPPSLCFPIPV